MKTALVLGGGGARGIAHVGVLKVLEENGIKIDMIVGCSFGAIVGAMYAQHPNASIVEARFYDFLKTDAYDELGVKYVRNRLFASDDYLHQVIKSVKNWMLLNVAASKASFLKSFRLQNAIYYLLDPGNIQDTKIPFYCNATELITGKAHLFEQGDIHPAVIASASIPGYFPAVEIGKHKYVDGGATYTLPVDFARKMGADLIIAVEVHPQLPKELDLDSAMDVVLRSNAITASILSQEICKNADVIISPPVKEYMWYEFDRFKELLQAGEETTRSKISDIQKAQEKFRKRWWQRLLPWASSAS